MKGFRIYSLSVLAFLVAGALAGGASGRPTNTSFAGVAVQAKLKVPAWNVTGKPVTREKADTLMDSFGTFDNGLQEDGSITYVDPERFLFLPSLPSMQKGPPDEGGMGTTSEGPDVEAIAAINVISGDEAVELTEGALADAELDPLNGTKRVIRTPMLSNSFFDGFTASGTHSMHQPIDTAVTYDLKLGRRQIPLIGPGADVRVSFDGDAAVTGLHYALWSIRQGQNIVIIPPKRALKLAFNAYRSQCGQTDLQGVKLTSELVYYAPPLSMQNVKRIMPAYAFSGTGTNGEEQVQLRQLFVPAAENSVRASIAAFAKARSISARALVRGGQPPYQFRWESCSTPLDPEASKEPNISYNANGRAPSNRETLVLHVTDANGQKTSAVRTLTIGPAPHVASRLRKMATLSRLDVGASTVGSSQGLPGCLTDTAGWVGRMSLSGVPTQFNWTNLNAWESDFKDPSRPGGNDSSYADDVDATFYCGHANGDGFTFSDNHTDGFLHFNDAFWGNRDLEWLGIAACGPLQDTSSGLQWWQRWGAAFGGLHMLLGYQTTSFDATLEGSDWANYMLGAFWWGGPMTVRQAWVQMAINNQPSSVEWSVMGVIGAGGVWNYNDFFWGKGPTGPDIPPASIVAFWKLSGVS